ncbi:MAG TPA: tetratricopeptide repeat protein [Thermoanaerobaculales bacterium]|nr:tetratricopeptide repeat protein [Thermoanaerobaculales bacterium]
MMRWIGCSLLLASAALLGCSSTASAPGTQGAADGPTKKQQQAAENDPLASLTLMRQGSVLVQQEQYQQAIEKFLEANRVAPGNPVVHNMLGLCHLQLRQYDKALSSFNTALDLAPSFTDARNNRGTTYLALGQLRLAEVDFLAVLGDSTYPHRYQVYYNLGAAYSQQGQLGAAEENLRKAVTAPFPVFEAYIRLAEVFRQQGRDAEAVELLEEAELRFPDRPEAAFALGRMLADLGRIEEARPYLEKVIAKEPGSERARQAAALLEAP